MSRGGYRSMPVSRPGSVSDQLSDLHVYVVPVDIWRERFNNLLNQSVTETVSLGIIRVPPDMRLIDVREEIVQQLEGVAPQDYVFLRSCGRSLTRLKSKQEYQLKVRHCLPPVAYAPELFLLEASALNFGSDTDSRSQSSMRPLNDRDSPRVHRSLNSLREGYRSPGNKSYRERDGYMGKDNYDRFGQPDKWRSRSRRNKNGEMDHERVPYSRTQRSEDRASPYKHNTPLPKINPSSPTRSRGPSPEFRQSGKWDSEVVRPSKYNEQSDEQSGKWDSDHPVMSESQDPYSNRTDRSSGHHDPYSAGHQSIPSDHNDTNSNHRKSDSNEPNPDSETDPYSNRRESNPNESNQIGQNDPFSNHDQSNPNESNQSGQNDPYSNPRESPESVLRDLHSPDKDTNHDKSNEKFPDERYEEYRNDKPQESPRRENHQPYSQKVPYDSEKAAPTQVDDSTDYDRKQRSDNYSKVDRDPPQQDSSRDVAPSDNPPPQSPTGQSSHSYRNKGQYEPRSTSYTTNTNEDSGIAEPSPDNQYRGNRDSYNEENERRRRDLQNRLNRDKIDADQDDYLQDQYRFEDMADRDLIDRERFERDDAYRRQWVDDEKRKREEDKRRKEEESQRMGDNHYGRDGDRDHSRSPDRGRSDRDRDRSDRDRSDRDRSPERNRSNRDDYGRNKLERTASDDELARYPSPPELQMQSPLQTERLTDSARRRKKEEKEKLMKDLETARESRKHTEKEREDLVKKAKQLQNKTQNRRNYARDIWKKKYFEEKKKTPPLEEQTNRLRHELDGIHRKLMTTLEGPKEKNVRFGEAKPSLKNNYVIQCTKLQHDIEDLRRRVDNAKMKLTAEMKVNILISMQRIRPAQMAPTPTTRYSLE